ncbi:bacterial DnaA protein helix-turn-helix domain protein [Candidatus Scalindua japonica]|uniref:Bacterial DnaA protein helix-turn-helix domain protein n=1 Tax=Candidatus Scalindua japonica TaxID=1284222 RepID=A0A286TXJ8_9BACT|nr:hypothetical protein [Candidatus Scalindua japonica]GAX60600.1 bacterial DnaA protein helix-turn-helix domain protein [Candidatus Scalindua japonica]
MFRGRFKAILIQAEEYLAHMVKYVHKNPLKAKIINETICDEFNIEENMLYQTRRGVVNVPRLFAISLSCEMSGLSFTEIAKKYKIKSYKTIASSNFRLKERVKKNRKIHVKGDMQSSGNLTMATSDPYFICE